MNSISARTLLLLLFFTYLVAAANFTQCLEDFKADPSATGGVDSHGHNVSAADAVGLTYRTCTERCGSTAESFSWRQFAQSFVWWLLPWLVLVGQLPLFSGRYIDDFLSAIMSVGSPALAAYSLMITSFNTRMVYQRANRMTHEDKVDVAKSLVALQQTALHLTKDPRLLDRFPVDDGWRQEVLERFDKRNAWSFTTRFSVAWVVITFIFTLVDAFVSLDDPSSGGSEGLAVGTLWLWSLCLVIGWLSVPIFSSSEVKAALRSAEIRAAKRAVKKIKHQAAKIIRERIGGAVVDRVKAVNTKFQKRTRNSEASKEPDTDPVAERGSNSDSSLSYGYLRARAESQREHDNLSIGEIQTAQQSVASVAHHDGACSSAGASLSSIHSSGNKFFIYEVFKSPLHRDKFRHPATFNYSRIMWYLVLVDDVFRVLNEPVTAGEKERPFSQVTDLPTPERTTFPPGVFNTMFKSAIFALLLQIGITGAALVIIIFTPTVGLGCRSLGYTIYGGVSITIMFLAIISTILTRISETRKETSHCVGIFTAFFAITLRRICYLLAVANSVGLIVLSCFQFSNFLANCYCNSSVIGRGTNTYIVIFLQDWISTMRKARIIGIAAAAGSVLIFMISLWRNSTFPADMI